MWQKYQLWCFVMLWQMWIFDKCNILNFFVILWHNGELVKLCLKFSLFCNPWMPTPKIIILIILIFNAGIMTTARLMNAQCFVCFRVGKAEKIWESVLKAGKLEKVCKSVSIWAILCTVSCFQNGSNSFRLSSAPPLTTQSSGMTSNPFSTMEVKNRGKFDTKDVTK